MWNRQAAARAGGRKHPRRRNADVSRVVEAHRQEDAQEGSRQERQARSTQYSGGTADRVAGALRALRKNSCVVEGIAHQGATVRRSEENPSELQSLMRNSYAV